MGMAASQARYLGLAARKTNVEYQGQQINQARTALGNQSADLWNQMLGMSVPVAPNTEDFVTTQYSFSDGQNDFEIISMVPSDEEDAYNYTVKYRYFEKEIKGIENTNTNPQVQAVYTVSQTTPTITYADSVYKIGTDVINPVMVTDEETKAKLRDAGILENDTQNAYTYELRGKTYYVMTTSNSIPTEAEFAVEANSIDSSSYKLGNTEVTQLNSEKILADPNLAASLLKIAEDNKDSNIASAINNAHGSSGDWSGDATKLYTYIKNGTTYYACETDLENSLHNSTAISPESTIDRQAPMKQYYTAQMDVEKVQTDRALMDDASGTGRYTSIKLKNYNTVFDLKTESTTNEEAYNQAMNQYYFDMQQYDKKVADINAKTSLIQEEDRTLELRLKQLDTEHNALQTEMEAVKKVMDKNVEDTFKTFGG